MSNQTLSLPDELILMLLNEQNGYFHQVQGWTLNCAIVGAVLAELSLISRIDTDMQSLSVLDGKETGNPVLNPMLKEIVDEPVQHDAQYWIERLAVRAEAVIDLTLERLVKLNILEHHEGDFWTLKPTKWHANLQGNTASQFIKTRISECIFTDTIPHPRDVIVICLINSCDVLRFIFQLDEDAEKRIELICRMDLIGRSISESVERTIHSPLLRRRSFKKKIPTASLAKLPFNPHLRTGNIPALFASLAEEYGPVFQFRPPFKPPMIFVAGSKVNRWIHKNGRLHLRSKDFLSDVEKIYGAGALLPSVDGADHFRLRKSLHLGYSRKRLEAQLESLYVYIRTSLADWKVGSHLPATRTCRMMMNAQVSPLFLSIESQDIVEDLMVFKERALNTHVINCMPKFMLYTPRMKRKAKAIQLALQRVQKVHTPAQRAGAPRELADDLLSLHASDPQFLPEANLGFYFSAPMLASLYLGDALSFALYAMASQPALYTQIQSEADALFSNGDPNEGDYTKSAIDVSRRFLLEVLRMYPIVPMSLRNVTNTCVIEDYELPLGERVYVAQTAAHYMSDAFPDPYTFDIDRYLPPRSEHRSFGYAPYGLGTHTCLGKRWLELHLVINLLMIAHYFRLELSPKNYSLRINPMPSMCPSLKMKLRVVEQIRDIPT